MTAIASSMNGCSKRCSSNSRWVLVALLTFAFLLKPGRVLTSKHSWHKVPSRGHPAHQHGEPSHPGPHDPVGQISSSVNAHTAAIPHTNCPRLQVLRDGQCVDAIPSCHLTAQVYDLCMVGRYPTVDGGTSCECLAECEAAWHLSGSDPLIPCFFSNGNRMNSLDEALSKQWHWFRRSKTVEPGCPKPAVPEIEDPEAGKPIALEKTLLTSITKCDHSCNERGWCVLAPPEVEGVPNPKPPRCSCFPPWSGTNCSELDLNLDAHRTQACHNDCSGRGRCVEGVCLCNASAWGIDCSLPLHNESKAADIYVYELPPGLNAWWGFVETRALGRSLHEALLRSPYRTADPEKATLFWVPVDPISGVSYGQALLALDYVRKAYPFYNRSQGRDHAIAYGWDSGSCWISKHPLAVHTIQISNFGLDKPDRKMECGCQSCGPAFTLLIPDMMEQRFKKLTPLRYGQPDTTPRPTWIYFSGGITGDERAALAALIANGTYAPGVEAHRAARGDVQIFVGDQRIGDKGGKDLGEGMSAAKFCLAPPGSGFGTRGTLGILLGCVPVYIGDIRQPWDDVLDYKTFSIRVTMPQLPQLLDIVAAADYEALKAGLGQVWHLFSWASVLGPIGGEPLQHDALHMMLHGARKQARRHSAAAAVGTHLALL